MVGGPLVHERETEQGEPGERDDDADPLVTRQPPRPARGDRREHDDPRGADRLHERERGQRQRHDVDAPAAGLRREADQPRAGAQQ